MTATLRLLAWCCGLVLVLAGLHLLGGGDLAMPAQPGRWADWVDDVGPAVVIAAGLRLCALGLAWYLVLATVVGSIGRALRRTRAVAMADVVTPRFLRRLLASAGGVAISGVGLALATAPVAVGVDQTAAASKDGASLQPTATLRQITPVVVPIGETGSATISAVQAEVETPAEQSTADFAVLDLSGLGAALAEAARDHPPSDESWVVACGDHLWMIAEEVLAEAWGTVPDEHEVADYWRTIIEVNRDRLVAPENPDLLLPGQVLTIPAPPVVS